MNSYIGNLRSIFHANGRDSEWDRRLGLENPAADTSLQDYLRLAKAEQLQARVTPKEVILFFVDRLTQLSAHLQHALHNAKPLTERFLVVRVQAYFKTVSLVVIVLAISERLRWKTIFDLRTSGLENEDKFNSW